MKSKVVYRRDANKVKHIMLYQKRITNYLTDERGRIINKEHELFFIGRVYGVTNPGEVFELANWSERCSKRFGKAYIKPTKHSNGIAGSDICFRFNNKCYVCEPIGWKTFRNLKEAKEYLLNREYQLTI